MPEYCDDDDDDDVDDDDDDDDDDGVSYALNTPESLNLAFSLPRESQQQYKPKNPCRYQ